jgi:hypothetical protein
MTRAPIYVVDEIGTVVSAVDALTSVSIGKHINYMYGHPLEIINRLQLLTNSVDQKQRASKYPLVALFQDFEEQVGKEPGVYSEVSLHMIIANITEPQFITEQRYEKNFKPVLYPIYQELLRQIASPSQKLFFVEDEELIQHTKIDRVYWGKQGLYGGTANPFNDFLDCIEIKDLRIKFFNEY